MDQAKLISIYLSQGTHYHSDSKGDMIPIKDMHPTHAANAARMILTEAPQWMMDAGATERGSRIKDSAVWMMNQPLWTALVQRAQS